MYKKLFKHKVTGEIVDSYPNTKHGEYENFFPSLKCPLCEGECVGCEEINNRTYIYVCEQCPFIGLEYYNDRNSADLLEYLARTK